MKILAFLFLTILTAFAFGSAYATKDRGLIKFTVALLLGWIAMAWLLLKSIY